MSQSKNSNSRHGPNGVVTFDEVASMSREEAEPLVKGAGHGTWRGLRRRDGGLRRPSSGTAGPGGSVGNIL